MPTEIIEYLKGNTYLWISIILVLAIIVVFNITVSFTKKKLLKKTKSKIHRSNIKLFSRLVNICFIILVISVAFFSYIDSWAGFGIAIGLITAALGFALQKPITGIAAWIMILFKRPFNVGDRIRIGDIEGEVQDISLSYIHIDEIGGTIDSDAHSGRNVLVPNYLLFEDNIINYNLTDDFILGRVKLDVTYESNLDKAMKIAEESAKKCVKHIKDLSKRKVRVRVMMKDSSIEVTVLFYESVKHMREISSNITKEIFDRIKKEKDIEIAYPHTEIVFKGKDFFKKK